MLEVKDLFLFNLPSQNVQQEIVATLFVNYA